eukprot:COSAG06_NODE_33783_length_484_cov_0.766234_1_plen_51_part_10
MSIFSINSGQKVPFSYLHDDGGYETGRLVSEDERYVVGVPAPREQHRAGLA